MNSQNALQGQKMGVQEMYTEKRLREYLIAETAKGRSLRQIAAQFGKPVKHSDIQRGLLGEFPKSSDKREAMGLPLAGVEINVIFLLVLVRYFKPPRPRIYHSLDTMPKWALRWQIENREEI